MKIITKQLPSNHNLFLFGDGHIGNALRHKKGFDRLVNMMHSEYAGVPAKANFGIDHGDIIEAILLLMTHVSASMGLKTPYLRRK